MNRIEQILETNVNLREKLFAYGYIFLEEAFDDTRYPFYGMWSKEEVV